MPDGGGADSAVLGRTIVPRAGPRIPPPVPVTEVGATTGAQDPIRAGRGVVSHIRRPPGRALSVTPCSARGSTLRSDLCPVDFSAANPLRSPSHRSRNLPTPRETADDLERSRSRRRGEGPSGLGATQVVRREPRCRMITESAPRRGNPGFAVGAADSQVIRVAAEARLGAFGFQLWPGERRTPGCGSRPPSRAGERNRAVVGPLELILRGALLLFWGIVPGRPGTVVPLRRSSQPVTVSAGHATRCTNVISHRCHVQIADDGDSPGGPDVRTRQPDAHPHLTGARP